MRILGIDFGYARTGIAISDALGWTAQPVGQISSWNVEALIAKIEEYVKQYQVERIVLGFPKNMNGTVGERGEKTKEFAETLKTVCGVDVILWDERLTTVASHRILSECNVRGDKRKKQVDTLSAELILQGYLDSLR